MSQFFISASNHFQMVCKMNLFKFMSQNILLQLLLSLKLSSLIFLKEYSSKSSPKTVNSVIVYSSSCRSKPLCPSFYCKTQKKIIWKCLSNVEIIVKLMLVIKLWWIRFLDFSLFFTERVTFDCWVCSLSYGTKHTKGTEMVYLRPGNL